MKIIFLLIMISICSIAQTSKENNDDETYIRSVIQEQENAWNNGDSKQYARSFQEEGVFTIITGAVFHSRSSLEERVAFILKSFFKNSKLIQTIKQIRFINNNAAILEIEIEMTKYQGLPPGVKASKDKVLRTSMLQVMLKDKGEWKVAAFHNIDIKVP